jgi:hypothetical protein
MAAKVGVSKDTVQRVWSARGLKPHLVLSARLGPTTRTSVEKLIDVVWLYLDPPEHAVKRCMDDEVPCASAGLMQPRCPW